MHFFVESYKPGHPVILYGLLPHEQKMSVMHFVVKRCHGNKQPIKSKERLIFHVGYRRFAACPVFSQHTNSDKHKVLIDAIYCRVSGRGGLQ